MRHTTIGAHRDTHDAEAIAFWVFGGIIMLIAFGEALAVLAAVVAIVAAASWIYRTVERRFERNDERNAIAAAPVTPLRLTGHGDAGWASADPRWHGPRAA
ncbi:hypothetical protein A5787_25205 [Mycobacterium sp. 852002-50816_SCH5313054-b]|uniref:hypothetical protein n=1 Tax=Mycobacterium sp. 852002-50816_SCH5313054-b TaxID=1834092 RepID=UPI0007FCE318|nr:hypothetical protein [Mycobacterium sp. 852002-50816_SCH5313054-b]OBF57481.1 hypothetical protein A5787_25205 [Mycobacterium sp. 852002-50816_SCH5313054-b]